MGDTVRLTIVRNEGEAEIVCGMLRLEGVRCAYRVTDAQPESGGSFGGWREIIVDADDLALARELLPG